MHVTVPVDIRARIQQRSDGVEVSIASSEVQWRRMVPGVAGIGIGALLQQESNNLDVSAPGCGVQPGAAVRVTRAGKAGVGQHELPHGLEVASATGKHQSLDGVSLLLLLDVRFQCPPAREPVLPRDVEERGCQFGLGIGTAEGAKTILREFLQIFERGSLGER
jgi:hypothetical protein